MKKYLTYKRKKISDNYYQDPNTNNRVELETNWVTKFTETAYEHADWRFLAYVEYPDETTNEQVEYFRLLDPAFEFTFITEAQATDILNETYGWEVVVTSFVFTDNRTIDIPS